MSTVDFNLPTGMSTSMNVFVCIFMLYACTLIIVQCMLGYVTAPSDPEQDKWMEKVDGWICFGLFVVMKHQAPYLYSLMLLLSATAVRSSMLITSYLEFFLYCKYDSVFKRLTLSKNTRLHKFRFV